MSSINYDLRLIKAVAFDVDGVLSPSTIPLHPDGTPMRMVNIKDGYALQLAVKMGLHVAIITGADSEAVRKRFEGLGIKDVYMKVSTKLPCLRQWMEKYDLQPHEVAYVGDDIPDYEAMQAVGLSIAPADAAQEIKEGATSVSRFNGGEGVGRDILEQLLKSQGLWMSNEKAFGW